MNARRLRTLKEVEELVRRPAHRVIHLCEKGLVKPAVDAQGRGSSRQFCRDDILRILIALQLQEASVQIPMIQPLMDALDRFERIPEIQEMMEKIRPPDLVKVILTLGSVDNPVLGYLRPPDRATLVVPKHRITSRPDLGVDIQANSRRLIWEGAWIVANLTAAAGVIY